MALSLMVVISRLTKLKTSHAAAAAAAVIVTVVMAAAAVAGNSLDSSECGLSQDAQAIEWGKATGFAPFFVATLSPD
jgi:hypothetical protein